MRILGIDPGITTGYALVDDGTLVSSGTLAVERLSEILTVAMTADVIVVERVPVQPGGKLSRDLGRVVGMVDLWFPDATYVSPGVWKPVSQSWDVPELPTTHQRDAFRIAEYHRKSKENKHGE